MGQWADMPMSQLKNEKSTKLKRQPIGISADWQIGTLFKYMATTEFIAAIELGSSKVTGIAGRKNSDGSMQVLAYAKEDSSSFIRKGVIYNLNKTAQSLTSIINRLEGDLKESIAKVYVGISGQSLRTVRNVVSRDSSRQNEWMPSATKIWKFR